MEPAAASPAAAMRRLLGPLRQIGYVVDNVEAAAADWAERYGVGPWRIRRGFALNDCRYRGTAIDVTLTLGSSYSNGIEIELIEQTAGPASMYSDFLTKSGPGAQHVCFYPPDYDAAYRHLVDSGMRVELEGAIRTTRFAYLSDDRGQVTEIAAVDAAGLSARAERSDAANTWDGIDPVRVR